MADKIEVLPTTTSRLYSKTPLNFRGGVNLNVGLNHSTVQIRDYPRWDMWETIRNVRAAQEELIRRVVS